MNRKEPVFHEEHLCIVTWGDAYANLAYYEGPDKHDCSPMIIKDVGWIAEENDECIVLVSSLSETGSRRNMSVIPLVNIIKIEEIDFT